MKLQNGRRITFSISGHEAFHRCVPVVCQDDIAIIVAADDAT